MKIFRLLIATLMFLSVAFASKPTAILGPGLGSANFRVPYREQVNRVLSADTTYILTGWYFIDSTYSLTIPAGTLVRGDSASGGTLIIARGAKIFAQGTPARPIILTSNKPAGTRVPGDWGGVILLGAAPTNKPTTTQIEGGFSTIPNAQAMYGGSDPLDNSGILSYVRIEFAGIAFAQDNEINGLTFGGVGAGTTVDHIQVSYSNDDDYEWFGGTVNCKYLVSWCNLDDTYDTDFGFSGKLQFLYAKRDPLLYDYSSSGSSNGFESDNEGTSPYSATPRTKPMFCNVTMVGPQSDTNVSVNSHWGNLSMLRRATELSIYNSVIVGWPNALNIRDTLTQRASIDDRLQIRNTSICGKYGKLVTASSSPSTGNIAGYDVVAWFNGTGDYPATGNLGGIAGRNPSDVGFASAAFNLNWTNNPVPGISSELATAGTSYQGRLAGDAWFDSVGYRGAFDPSKARDQQWDWGWTNYDPQNYDPEAPVTGVSFTLENGWNLASLPVKGTVTVNTAFPTAASGAFEYEAGAGYVSQTTVSNGLGFWIKSDGPQSFATAIGIMNLTDTFAVSPKWNMIGALSVPVAVRSLVSDPPGNLTTSYFGFNNGYQIADTLYPGKGYWVKAAAAGSIYLDVHGTALKSMPNGSLTTQDLNFLTVSDAERRSQNLYFTADAAMKASLESFELPPVPPASCFDARFTSQRYVEVGTSYHIALQGAYPMQVSLSLQNGSQNTYELEELQNGKIAATHAVHSGSAFTISDSRTTELVLTLTGTETTPLIFALGQNYPNPFNPTTLIQYQLPAAGFVKLAVYNTLGQEVAALVNGVQDAGFKSVQFNAGNIPSGTYFYTLTAGRFTETKRMVVIK